MEKQHYKNLSIKAQLGSNTKRFELSASCTFSDLMKMLKDLFKEELKIVKYKDEDDELITMSTEEEFTEAIKTVPKTSGVMKLYLNGTCSDTVPQKRKDSSKDNPSQIQRQDSKPKHKIESASQLSKDIELVNSELTGRIPLGSSALKFGVDTHFISQQPGCRKVRHLSSASASSEPRKRKNKNRRCSVRSSTASRTSSSSSSSSSDSSSSDSSSEEEYDEEKSQSNATAVLNELFMKLEESFCEKMIKDLQDRCNKMKEEITISVRQTVLGQLNGGLNINHVPTSPIKGEDMFSKSTRVRYRHRNVLCDNCSTEIFGPRYKCGNCSDYDLCERCEDIEGIHTPSHVFLKLHYPSVHAETFGRKPSPLLNGNIYEEREREREREELLQRKFDFGSEFKLKVLEKIEKHRLKMEKAKRRKEVRELRKDEWKKVRKELRKNRNSRRLKYFHSQQEPQRTQERQNNYFELQGFQELTLSPLERECSFIQRTNDSSSLQDENVMTALTGLKIVQTSQEDIMPCFTPTTSMKDEPKEILVQSTVLEKDYHNQTHQGPELIETGIGHFEDIHTPRSDMSYEVSSTVSEDFIVVARVFDLDTPLDAREVRKVLKNDEESDEDEEYYLEESDTEDNDDDYDTQSSFSITTDVKPTDPEPELPSTLGHSASVFGDIRNDGNVFSNESEQNIIDDNVQNLPESLSPEVTLPPLNLTGELTVIETQPLESPKLPDDTSKIVDKQPEAANTAVAASAQVISTQPPLAEQIVISDSSTTALVDIETEKSDKSESTGTESSIVAAAAANTNTEKQFDHQPKTLLEQAAAAQHRLDQSKGAVELIHEAQAQKDKAAQENFGRQQCSDEFLKDVAIAAGSNEAPPLPQKDRNSSFGEVISDVMASVVDAAASVASTLIQPSHSPVAAYNKKDDNVMLGEREKQSAFEACMAQLFDMGFYDRELNSRLLRKYNNDVGDCVNHLVNAVDHRWHEGRH